MRRWEWRLALDVVGVGALLAVAVVGAGVALDGIEQVQRVVRGELVASVLAQTLLARLPALVAGLLPVALATAAVLVVAWWRHSGRLDALRSMGVGPVQVATVLAGTAVVAAMLGASAREVVAPAVAGGELGPETWAVVSDADGTRLRLRARSFVGDRASGVELAWLRAGRLVGAGRVRRAVWTQGRWELDQASAFRWDEGPRRPRPVTLPSPATWRASAPRMGPDAPAATLWRAPPGAVRTTWLVERLSWSVATALAILLAGALALAGRVGSVAGVIVAVGLVLGRAASFTAADAGSWSPWTAAGLPVAVAGAGTLLAVWWADRRAGP